MTMSTSRLSPLGRRPRAAARRAAAGAIGQRDTVHDDRWPAILAALAALRDAGRYSVRIVDADCGAGGLLLAALRHARTLGFTAIEGRGIDGAPSLVARATAAAARLRDPAIGVTVELGDLVTALADEADLPADIILFHRIPVCADRAAVAEAVTAAGRLVILDAGRAAVPPTLGVAA